MTVESGDKTDADLTDPSTPEPLSGVVDTVISKLKTVSLDKLNLAAVASSLFRIKGEAYSMKDHFLFENMFSVTLPRRVLWRCGRQMGKSANICFSRALVALILSYYNILFVCPRHSQVKRLSNQYMKGVLTGHGYEDDYLLDRYGEQTTLQRTLESGSIMFFSFALLDPDRIRSIFASEVVCDEVQDLNWDFIPVIAETLSGSKKYRNQRYSGTPKTLDNTIDKLWDKSSKAEWATRCQACNYWNIASVAHDLMKMIQPRGPCCAKCGKVLNPATGYWVHARPQIRPTFAGYHTPQVVHPYHYGSQKNWNELIYKLNNYPMWRFMNECLGESFESSARLITLLELQGACNPDVLNTLDQAGKASSRARITALGIDWGGGGDDSKSSTTVSLVGSFSGDELQTLYMERLPLAWGITEQIQRICFLIEKLGPSFITHDYNGEGASREVLLIKAGIPANRIIPFSYGVGSKKAIVAYEPNKKGYRSCYFLDKPRSLITLCHMIKAKKLLFPAYARLSTDVGQAREVSSDNHLQDFLNLVEDRKENPRGSDIVLVTKIAETFDDFAHSTNFAATAIWYNQGRYPEIAEILGMMVPDEFVTRIYGNQSW